MSEGGKPGILVVDGDSSFRRLLRSLLEADGYAVREAASGRLALGEITLEAPALVILEAALPDTLGTDILRALRPLCSAPVLMLSASREETILIAALDAGADDYLTKPFDVGELRARIRGLLRRAQAPAAPQSLFHMGPVEVDLERRWVRRKGEPVALTPREYSLLRLLLLHRDQVLTHSQILQELWGNRGDHQNHYLRVYMMRLRRKLGPEVSAAGYFQTEAGIGYCFVSNPACPP